MNIAEYKSLSKNRLSTGKSKYHNRKTKYKNVLYMSKKEAMYARHLDLMRKAKNPAERVVSWQEQVPFLIEVNGHKICKYLADFVVTFKDDHMEVIDVKGWATPLYKLKKKLVEAQYGITIKEV